MKKNEKVYPLSPKIRSLIERQRTEFQKKFGREPGPDDPIFFDPDSDVPAPISQQKLDEYNHVLVTSMIKVGVDPALIYAFKKTGRLVTEKNQRFLSKREMAEWTDAVEEYRLWVDAGRIA